MLYRQAKNKKAQIKILSELTLLPEKQIKEILTENGFDIKNPQKDVRKYIEGVTDLHEQIRILSSKGFPVSIIAKALNQYPGTVAKIRRNVFLYNKRKGLD